jgi:hypothetical protein
LWAGRVETKKKVGTQICREGQSHTEAGRAWGHTVRAWPSPGPLLDDVKEPCLHQNRGYLAHPGLGSLKECHEPYRCHDR